MKNGLSPSKIGLLIDRSAPFVRKRLEKFKIYQPKIYDRIGIPFGKKFKNGKIVPDEKEVQIIKQVVTLHKQKFNFAQIAKALNCQGRKSRNGHTWKRWMIKKIVDREQKIKG